MAGFGSAARRIVVREAMAQGPAELANDNALQISRCFSALGNRRRVQKRSPSPDFDQSPAAPRLDFRRFNTHIVCQNVAGLWLKYGAKSAKIEVFWRPKIKLHDATIC
jgi:hypothetical protein